MTGHEIRQKFLDYFEKRGHRVVRSSPLLPANDPSLLFANAGMNQFKDVFLGIEKRDYARAASSQKCLRAGGKQNDLDEVGRTTRHHTFFEMLGNFSFGDYFKKEAVYFAWDLLVNEFQLDPKRLWFTVFAGDAEVPPDGEAARYWEQVGAPPNRVLRFGRKDNFWQMGDTGPCGPCSEVHYYIGEHPEDPEFNRVEFVNGPGDTTIEIWNLVFMQFNRLGEGESSTGQYSSYRLEPLPSPSVDTGAGLERLTAVLQGVNSNYETDLVRPIIDFIAETCQTPYSHDSPKGTSMRIIADHARATAFAIADGIAPGNLGRNYVLRKIMRRAIYHGVRELGLKSPFFHLVTDFVVNLMAKPYPELSTSRRLIEQTVLGEEKRFERILNVGEPRLAELFHRHAPDSPPMLEMVKTYDTYGVPRDLIRVVMGRHGYEVDEEEFNREFEEALSVIQSQSAPAVAAAASRKNREVHARTARAHPPTEFRGYDETETDRVTLLAIVRDNEPAETIEAGETGDVLFDRSPFYAEAGGQIGDTGVVEGETALAVVEDTFAPVPGYHFHRIRVESGAVRSGDVLTVRVDADRRRRIKANHTGTHLLHAALREVLGPHVKQAGSLVAPDRLRFDFTHYAALTRDEIAEIERLVNAEILQNRPVETDIMPLESALSSGAMALFGEKYASDVRVVRVPGFSTELCGGTHVHATGDIGPFKIISDSSIAAGVRRLEALTADAAINRFQADEQVIEALTERFRSPVSEIPAQVDRLHDHVRKYEREIELLRLKIAQSELETAVESAREIAGVRVLAKQVAELDANTMRQIAGNLCRKISPGVVVLGQAANGKASLLACVSSDLSTRVHAGAIISEISAIVGGKGGGRPDMATGGGPLSDRLQEALEASYSTVERILNQ